MMTFKKFPPFFLQVKNPSPPMKFLNYFKNQNIWQNPQNESFAMVFVLKKCLISAI